LIRSEIAIVTPQAVDGDALPGPGPGAGGDQVLALAILLLQFRQIPKPRLDARAFFAVSMNGKKPGFKKGSKTGKTPIG